jgi:hypothetical protein
MMMMMMMMMMMNSKHQQQQKKEKPICGGGVHSLKLEEKEHSIQFIHFNPVKSSFFSLLIFDNLTID